MRTLASARRWPIVFVSLVGTMLLAACGDDSSHNHPVDARPVDGAVADAADPDAALPDAMNPDATDVDAAMIDAGTIDATSIDAVATDANTAPMTSAEITAARGTADGTGLSLPITLATVTYVKPAIGSPTNDPIGFNIQAEKAGPALYVAFDPAMLSPVPAVGDVVRFTITEPRRSAASRWRAITGFSRSATGVDVNPLVRTDRGADVVTALGNCRRLFDLSSSVDRSRQRHRLRTGPDRDDRDRQRRNFAIRIPAALRSSIDLVAGCNFTLNNVPVFRFNAMAQMPAYVASDITLSGCPAPTVASAAAASATQLVVTFSRNVAPGSVMANGSQFTFDNGLTASAATVSGRTVTLTTSAQTGGTAYTVTVANTVTDQQGTALGTPNTATFTGFQVLAVVRINEVNANITNGTTACDLIELRVVSGGSMTGYRLQERDTATLVTFPTFTVATNDLIVVHMANGAVCNPGTAANETTAPNQQPQAMFSTNFDGASTSTRATPASRTPTTSRSTTTSARSSMRSSSQTTPLASRPLPRLRPRRRRSAPRTSGRRCWRPTLTRCSAPTRPTISTPPGPLPPARLSSASTTRTTTTRPTGPRAPARPAPGAR
jgi:hypothetical protein